MTRVLLATRMSDRLRGLLLTPASRDVMVLLPCGDIHTFGMAYAIDVAFIDRGGRVLRSARDVLPNKRLRAAGAVAVLERYAMPREAWFQEGEWVALGVYREQGFSVTRRAIADDAGKTIRAREHPGDTRGKR